MYSKAIQPAAIIGILLLLDLNGCLSDKEDTDSKTLRPAIAKLTRADDCGDLLRRIQGDVIAKVDLYVQATTTGTTPTSWTVRELYVERNYNFARIYRYTDKEGVEHPADLESASSPGRLVEVGSARIWEARAETR